MGMICRLVTADEMFGNALERFRDSYRDMPETWHFSDGCTVPQKLADAAAAKTHDEFAKVMGNLSWTHPSCDFCDAHVRVAIQIKREWDDDSKTICKACLTRTLTAFGPIADADTLPA